MSASPIVAEPFSIQTIDGHLKFLAEILKHGRRENRPQVVRKIDLWLDQRLKTTDNIPLDDELLMGGGYD